MKCGELKRKISKTGKTAIEYYEELDAYAEDEYLERMKLIETELREIKGGRLDAAVGVSIGGSRKMVFFFAFHTRADNYVLQNMTIRLIFSTT